MSSNTPIGSRWKPFHPQRRSEAICFHQRLPAKIVWARCDPIMAYYTPSQFDNELVIAIDHSVPISNRYFVRAECPKTKIRLNIDLDKDQKVKSFKLRINNYTYNDNNPKKIIEFLKNRKLTGSIISSCGRDIREGGISIKLFPGEFGKVTTVWVSFKIVSSFKENRWILYSIYETAF